MDKAWTIYDKSTGRIRGHLRGDEEHAKLAETPTRGLIPGTFDPVVQRVNLATGEVVNFIPDKPPTTEHFDHTWDAQARRWMSVPTRAGRIAQNDELLRVRMAQAEAGQARALRDIALAVALGNPPPQAAVQALLRIERDVADLRSQLGKDG
jgi:hypothetical protein